MQLVHVTVCLLASLPTSFRNFLSTYLIEITWNYGEAHSLQVLHDGIGSSVKHKVYSDVTSQKVVNESVQHFVKYDWKVCNINVINRESSEINATLVNDRCYITGTLKIQWVKRITTNETEFYHSSQYKKTTDMLTKHSF